MLARLLKLNLPTQDSIAKSIQKQMLHKSKSVNKGAYIFQQSYSSATGLVDGVTNIFMAQGTSVCNI